MAFSPTDPSLLAVSSWDTWLRVYDASEGVGVGASPVVAKFSCDSPQLACAWAGSSALASGGLDKAVRLFDIEASGSASGIAGGGARGAQVLGAHGAAVRCVGWVPDLRAVATGGWDCTARLWDPRAPGSEAVLRVGTAHKVFAMSLAGASTLIVGTAERQLYFFDLRAGGAAAQRSRESSLKHQTRALCAMPDGRGYIVGSIEGRCGVEYLADAEHAKSKYAFKCHRVADPATPGEDRIFPVNAIAFHPTQASFATGGGDGGVCIWDYKAKKRLAKLRECETSVASLAFNWCVRLQRRFAGTRCRSTLCARACTSRARPHCAI